MNTTYYVIGLMSGTSLDGLDMAYCRISKNTGETWNFEILHTKNVAYTDQFRDQLNNAITLSSVALLELNNTFGIWLGNQVATFIETHQLDVDFIASHGHTVFHQPHIGVTYQIGSGQHIANQCKHKVIADFRTNDVALGGQGAPLVPIGDRLLFGTYDFCLNLGGIGNISFEHKNQRIAYDISPVNMLLNQLCQRVGIAYDDGGQLAATGQLNTELLSRLNALSFYQLPYPKSLGIEWYTAHVVPLINKISDSTPNLLYTAAQHIATQIALQIADATKSMNKKYSTVFVTGGGAKNTFLIQQLQQRLEGTATIIIPEEVMIDFKEALIFAFMGVLRECDEINCLRSVTGAKRDSSSGVLFYPK